ncbi:MAG: FliA/WhiG family RNA polymerase sigma factor [Verrucomicrobia bacterium TMED40]|mgnify:FL=1|nr:MAG: FliA/WhiG family RNA polymerase sigma factor [Verrucomicrobia bacterium TMED40]
MSPPPTENASFDQRSAKMKAAADRYCAAMQKDKTRDKWIEDYLPLVKSIVSRLRHHFPDHYDSEDMYGIGAKALILSVNQYDPAKGKSFGNYAALRIKGSLLDELRKIDSLPRTNRAKARSLQLTVHNLEAELKRQPSEDEIIGELRISKGDYGKLLKETQPISFIPIDGYSENSGQSEEGLPLSETISDPTEQNALEKTEGRERITLLRERIKDLPDQQKKILMLYYYEELRLSEIGQIFGLTEGRISQILSHTVLTLKAHFKSLH